MTEVDRRHFLMSSVALPVALKASAQSSPNDTVRVAVVGFNGRGRAHISAYLKIPNVEIAALCDVDQSVVEKGCKMVEAAGKKRPATFTDIRKLLDDQSVDAVSLATPNFHHTLQTIWAVQAGKDVLVEKPCSYNMFEAQQIIAASRKYNRIVQDGTGAGAQLHEAKQRLQDGIIGEVYMARGLCFKWRDTIGRTPPSPVPPGVDYDLWTGPAPKREFTKNRFHYNWHWFWDTGNGDVGNQGIHQLDIARWGLGVTHPTKVSAIGGKFMFDDDQETPNTLAATWEFDAGGQKKMMSFDVRHWISHHEAGIGGERPGNTIGNQFYGANGYLVVDGSTYRTFLGKDQEPGPTASGGGDHYANFIEAVRSRRQQDLTAEIAEGALSCTLMHLANISYRVGRTLNWDAKTMTCIGDAEANALLTREYRAPFVVPKIT